MVAETDRRLEAIQRAQVGSLVGADKAKEPQEKIPKKLSPTLATQPKKYALEMWVEIETSPGMYSTPEDNSYSIDFVIDTINRTYPSCTGMYLDVAGHMLAFYGKKTNPRAGLLHDQGVVASKAMADIPSWMGYPAKWRVRCVSVSEASEILAGCKRPEQGSPTMSITAGPPVGRALLNHRYTSDEEAVSTDTATSWKSLHKRHGGRGN